jgi:hypothetical protein
MVNGGGLRGDVCHSHIAHKNEKDSSNMPFAFLLMPISFTHIHCHHRVACLQSPQDHHIILPYHHNHQIKNQKWSSANRWILFSFKCDVQVMHCPIPSIHDFPTDNAMQSHQHRQPSRTRKEDCEISRTQERHPWSSCHHYWIRQYISLGNCSISPAHEQHKG